MLNCSISIVRCLIKITLPSTSIPQEFLIVSLEHCVQINSYFYVVLHFILHARELLRQTLHFVQHILLDLICFLVQQSNKVLSLLILFFSLNPEQLLYFNFKFCCYFYESLLRLHNTLRHHLHFDLKFLRLLFHCLSCLNLLQNQLFTLSISYC